MRKHILLYILLCGLALGLPLQVRGQTYTYRYWTDNNAAGVQTGTATGEKSFDVDISHLPVGLHALHLQAQNSSGVLSAVHTQFFAKMSGTSAAKGQYWFDNYATSKKDVAATGTINIDASALSAGLHALHFQKLSSEGVPSAVHTQFFVKMADSKSVTARYWYDNDISTLHTLDDVSGTIDLDISELEPGLHTTHYQTVGSDGIPSSVRTEFIYIKAIPIAKIWIDDNADNAKTYGLTGEDIVIDVRKLKVGMHTLTVTLIGADEQVIGTQTVEFEVFPRMKTITLAADLETFSCDDDLNFQGVAGLRAYTAAGFNRATSEVIMHRVDDVPAYTGLLLAGTAGTTYQVPCEESPTVYVNMLAPTLNDMTIAAEADSYLNYLLDTENGLFAQADDEGSFLEANRAYLRLSGSSASGARRLKIRFGTEPCDVNGDNAVDGADIASIISVMTAVGVDPVSARNADVNNDGIVDIADIVAVINIIAANARKQNTVEK